MHYEYRYESVDTGGGFFFDNADCGHRGVIDAYAKEGWRFAGFVPTRFSSYGGIKALDLVFERPDGETGGTNDAV